MSRLAEYLLLFLLIIFIHDGSAQTRWDLMRDTALFTRQVSSSMRLMMNNNGVFGAIAFPLDSSLQYPNPSSINPPRYNQQVGLEYPVGSRNEHLFAGGLVVGGIMVTPRGPKKVVTTSAFATGSRYFMETKGHKMKSDSIFMASTNDLTTPTRRFFDDDGDGMIDEDEIDGFDNDGDWWRAGDDWNYNLLPDHGEPHVDEDAGAISEHDIYTVYRDSFPFPRIYTHTPMGITVWQKSYAWKTGVTEPILPIEFVITNTGQNIIDSVYVGFYAQIVLGRHVSIVANNAPPVLRQYQFGFMRSALTAYTDAVLRNLPEPTPFGITILGASEPLNTLRFTFRLVTGAATYDDSVKYNIMSSGIVQRDTTTQFVQYKPEQIIAIGPFRNFNPGKTIKFAIALVSGDRLNAGYNNVYDNALKALELYNRDYRPPNFPPSPPLRLTSLKNGVMLDWKWRPGDEKTDPVETWDDNNKYLQPLPPTHWRKINPPAGKTRGGRNFEGFRIWRSSYPIFKENSFNLLEQIDVDDDLNFEGQTGIQFTYADTPLVRGRKYWYAVTSFSIPDYFVTLSTDVNGMTIYDSTVTPSLESPIYENAKAFQPAFSTSYKLGEVRVVPNPYRTDKDYTFENGGWEGLGRTWFEDKRQIWFIHLPPRATIRIFSLMGEFIASIEHDDDARIANGLPPGQEEWKLLSSAYRAIASGVYVFQVESEYGTQTGKFVVIR